MTQANHKTAEQILKMSFSQRLNNGVDIHISEGDLIAFVEKYIPEFYLTNYKAASLAYLKNNQIYHLKTAFEHVINKFMDKHFFNPLCDLYFDVDQSSMDYSYQDEFEDITKSDFDDFITSLENFIPSLYSEGRIYITRHINFEERVWVFNDQTIEFSDEQQTMTLNQPVIDLFRNDILMTFDKYANGSFKYMTENAAVHYMNYDLAAFKTVLPNDLQILKDSDFSFDTLLKFLDKYSLIRKRA